MVLAGFFNDIHNSIFILENIVYLFPFIALISTDQHVTFGNGIQYCTMGGHISVKIIPGLLHNGISILIRRIQDDLNRIFVKYCAGCKYEQHIAEEKTERKFIDK